jgi:type I restriction enzyme M protein
MTGQHQHLSNSGTLSHPLSGRHRHIGVDDRRCDIDVFNAKQQGEDFSVVVSYRDIAAKNYSLSAGQYFDVKIEYVDITPEQFAEKMQAFNDNLESLFGQSRDLEAEIKMQLAGLKYE